ncbi:MAG TPA: CRISPR-associated endonuclease Cas1 [Firmicutes bacterium]|nr:CRISPR-associated endonuclease Cas1 [Bacillota bacterium]
MELVHNASGAECPDASRPVQLSNATGGSGITRFEPVPDVKPRSPIDGPFAEDNQETELLPVSAVAELLYCPRNFYYRMVEGAAEENEHVLIGRYQEEKRQARAQLSRDGVTQWRAVRVHSSSLGLSAVIDVVELGSELDAVSGNTSGAPCSTNATSLVIPVEFKKGAPPPGTGGEARLNDQVQICAQAMLLEEQLGQPVPYGYIYYAGTRRRVKVETTPELRARVKQAVAEARRILATREIPAPVNDARCLGCSLYERCLPAETVFANEKERGLIPARAPRPRRPTPGLNLGRVLLIDRPGAYVRNTGERLVVTVENEKVADVPILSVDEVLTFGRVQFTQPAMEALLERGVSVAMLSGNGRLKGFLQAPFSSNGLLRRRQVLAAESAEVRATFAREFVIGKLRNMRLILMRRLRQLDSGEAGAVLEAGPAERIRQAVQHLERMVAAAERSTDCDELLGIEGSGSRSYFQVFGDLLTNQQFSFPGRHRRPPTDPVNAMLSFAYTLLTNNARAAVEAVGLDPFIGLYHTNVYGRPALALDLIEEFRPLVADVVVLSVVNRKMVRPSDFEDEKGGYYLKDNARRTFLEAYTQRMNEMVTHPLFEYKVSYRRMLELQARFLAKALMGELPRYRSLVLR